MGMPLSVLNRSQPFLEDGEGYFTRIDDHRKGGDFLAL